jgi:TRAP transporter TAXI family solute receptor
MKRAQRLLLLFVIAIGTAVVLPASGWAQDKKHPLVQFTSGSPTGGWFPVASAMAELTNALYDGHPISVVAGAGGVGNPKRVVSGESDIGVSYGPFLKLATQGNNELYKQPAPQLRAIAGMTANKLHIVMDPSGGIGGLGEIKAAKPEMRVGTGPVGSTELFTLGEVFKEYGVSFEDFDAWGGRVDRLNTAGRSDAWQNRQADLVNFFINDPAAKVIELMSGRDGSKLLTIEEGVRDSLVENWGMIKFSIPANTYPNQPEDVATVGMPYVYFATTNLSAELVYDLTKTIAENQERLAATHSSFKTWKPENMPHGLGIELHEGAVRYYKERGWLK